MSRNVAHAVDLYRAGSLAESAECCRSILGEQPANSHALNLLGMIAHRQGDAEGALSLVEQALHYEPTAPDCHHTRGVILQAQARLEDAVAAFDEAVQLRPDFARAHVSRGMVLQQQGRSQEALEAYDQALRLNQDLPEAHLNRGVILQEQARLEEALEAFDEALRIKPNYGRALFNRGVILERQQRFEDAIDAYDNVLRTDLNNVGAHVNRGTALEALGRFEDALAAFEQVLRLRPNAAEAHFNRGNILKKMGRLEEALTAFDQALGLQPQLVSAEFNRGLVLRRQGRSSEALDAFEQVLRVEPDLAEAHFNRGNVLKDLGRLDEALGAYGHALENRRGYAEVQVNRGFVLKAQGRIGEAVAAYKEALGLDPNLAEAHSNYLFALNHDPAQDDAALLAAHKDWGELHGRHPDAFTAHGNSTDPDRTLKIGLVSSDFGRHPVGYFLQPLLAGAAADQVQFFCYSGRLQEDDLTEQLRGHAAAWRSTLGLSDAELAQVIRADEIDILVDLAGHTAGNRLGCFALAPAPVQVHWAGYCHSVPSMDYSIWDSIQVPEGAERWFVEPVLRLPDVRWCYGPPDYAPDVADPPVLERGHITFGSFNNLSKLNEQVIDLWARVVTQVPGSRLVLSWPTLANPEEAARFRRLFAERGIAPEQLEMQSGAGTHAGVLGEYADVDIALDPFPFSGCLTTCEALLMGVPVVTLPQSRPISRQSQAFLTSLGRTEWIANDPEDYIRIAADLASEPRRLASLRRDQRARMIASPLCDGPRFARHFEATLRQIWHCWCDSESDRREILCLIDKMTLDNVELR